MTAALAVLDRPALVLNKRWQPIQVTSVKEALGLVCKGSAKILEPETYQAHDIASWADVSASKEKFEGYVIRSAKLSLVAPEVIVLQKYEDIGQRSVVFSRRNIFKRDKYTCQYCGHQFRSEVAMRDLTIDHVMPKSRGGKSTWENCVLACIDCNKVKADRTPDEAGLRLRKVPKKPSWSALSCITPGKRLKSWQNFIDETYWQIELEP